MQKTYPRKYVYFKTSAHIATDRIIQRTHGNSRFENLDAMTVRENMEFGQELFNNILRATETANINILIVDALKPPAENAHLISDWLQKTPSTLKY